MPPAFAKRSTDPHVVLVDAYAPVQALAAEFRAQGYSVVRVQSTPYVPRLYESMPLVLDDFVANITHSGDLNATVDAVAAFAPAAVVAGGEIGVELADTLAERLGVPNNGTALSEARRDKHTMVETVRKAGLRAARQLRVTDADELAAWHRELAGRIVVKPLRSAGGDSIAFCDSPEESVAAYRRLVGTTNIFSARNTGAVAQEYLPGTEYMVNTVSRDGHHHVCDVWRTSRVRANGMIDLADALCLIAYDDCVVKPLSEYAFQVLDAVGIRHGPAHVEIRKTPAGPVLVEVGARVAGGGIPAAARHGIGESQLDWTVDAYLRPDRFHPRAGKAYQVKRFCALAGMVSPFEGTLRGYRDLDEIRRLDSFHGMTTLVQPGQRLHRTIDDVSYPLVVTLLHELEEVVQADLNTIRHLDGFGFYEVEPSEGVAMLKPEGGHRMPSR